MASKISKATVSHYTYFTIVESNFSTIVEYVGKVISMHDSEKVEEWLYIIRMSLNSICHVKSKEDSSYYCMLNDFVDTFYRDSCKSDIRSMANLMVLGCIHEHEDEIDIKEMYQIISSNKLKLTRFFNYIPSLLYIGTEEKLRAGIDRAISMLLGVEGHHGMWVQKMIDKNYIGYFKI